MGAIVWGQAGHDSVLLLSNSGTIIGVTAYAFDENRLLHRSWDTGGGCVADTVAELPGSAQRDDALRLVSALTGLSKTMWRTYTHPASAANSLESNSEGWRRQGERDAFGTVIDAPRKPICLMAGACFSPTCASRSPLTESAARSTTSVMPR